MLSGVDFDMEEMEAQLYSQVHYGNCEEENEGPDVNSKTFSPGNLVVVNPAVVNNVVLVQREGEQTVAVGSRFRRIRKRHKKLVVHCVPPFRGFTDHRLNNPIDNSVLVVSSDDECKPAPVPETNLESVSQTNSMCTQDQESQTNNVWSQDEDDDVILIEPQPPETIELDCDDPIPFETNPTVVSCPENDFLDKCVVVDSTDLPNTLDTIRTSSDSDSESSDSEIPLLPEFEFSALEDVSLNYKDFETYITPAKKPDSVATISGVAPKLVSVSRKPVATSKDTSDSSSESDYEDLPPNKTLTSLTSAESNVITISSNNETDSEAESVELLNVGGLCDSAKKQSEKKRQPKGFSQFWSDDMEKFYKESWGQENFSCEEEQKTMSSDPKLWKIIDADVTNRFATPRGPRCHRCRQFGHKAAECTTKSNIPKCILCGQQGHSESKCPNKLCVGCGQNIPFWTIYCQDCSNKRIVFCTICSLHGHSSDHCSDLWRRYHLTVEEGPIVFPKQQIYKPPEDRWCCSCASQGHLEHECNCAIRNYPPSNPLVHSYEDVYYNNPSRQYQPPTNTIPALLDLTLDNVSLFAVTHLYLTKKEASNLLRPDGVQFIKDLTANGNNLQIKVMKRRYAGKSTSHYTCVVQGSKRDEAIREIKAYISNRNLTGTLIDLLSAKSLNKDSARSNFQTLGERRPWERLARNTYKSIKEMEHESHKLKNRHANATTMLFKAYKALNAVLIVNFKLGDQSCVHLLRNWTRARGNFAGVDVRLAYEYVFLNGRRINAIDYRTAFSHATSNCKNVPRDFKRLRKSTAKMCKDFHLDKELVLLNNHYNLMLKKNYKERNVENFQRFCKRLALKQATRKSYDM